MWESFALGYTFGGFKTFSIALSIVLFQKSSAELLPQVLEKLPDFIKENDRVHIGTSFFIIILVWSLPYALASIPFLYFFHPNRDEFYKENDLIGIDWNRNNQDRISIMVAILGITYLYFVIFKANIFKMISEDIANNKN